jgi:simple sugar transport system ATP-binding protein
VDLQGVSLQVRAGEVVGIAGVSGNGQRSCCLRCRARTGARRQLHNHGEHRGRGMRPARRRALGLHFVPEERLGRGAVPDMSLAHNLLLTRREAWAAWAGCAWRCARRRRASSSAFASRPVGRTPGALAVGRQPAKFIVGREIDAKPRLLIVSQPTWGVDVGAAAQIRGAMLALRDAGCAVLVVSEELDELFEISDRLHVIARGSCRPAWRARRPRSS